MGERIRFLRISRNLSQDKLGAELGVSGAAVSQWESGGTKDLKNATFLHLCAYFGCNPHWLCFGEAGAPWERDNAARR